MKKIKTELTTWLKQIVQLKDEVEHRFSSLCNVQEKISLALKEGAGEEIKFSSHQTAKFQGEILNMKQENKKVSDQLQAGVDHITSIQVEVDRTLKKLDDEFGQSSGNQNAGQAPTRAKIQFRKLIFGSKRKKQNNNFMLSAFAS
ncbi:hypothetical protein LIER_30984 [Lithospermum erythrorhizon]|uniref:NET2A-D/KIP1-like C-terminal domain-containing protein n=1 Tax=Lithospermum erythrorhizon TaxID=34254 RepID=A0AAV3RPG9_LITER